MDVFSVGRRVMRKFDEELPDQFGAAGEGSLAVCLKEFMIIIIT